MADETPLFSQYQRLKSEHPNEILFFRLGDFYEMFDSDADEVSRLLNLTLTHRAGKHMCGIPYHASKIYIARLLRLGKKVAIAEQIGDVPKGKGLTDRKVIEVVTPGTALESEYLDGGTNNYLASFFVQNGKAGFSFIDVTTGEFRATSFPEENISENLPKEIGRANPKELLLSDNLKKNQTVLQQLSLNPEISVSWYPDWNFNADLSYERLLKQFKTANLQAFSLTKDSPEVPPAGFLLDYLQKTANTASPHIQGISVYKDSEFVVIDDSSRRNLEITVNLHDGTTQFTLFDCVNYTRTAMGCRLLRDFLVFPLTDISQIQKRQDAVSLFVKERRLLQTVQSELEGILDVERLSGRIAMDRAHAKDLQALRRSLELWVKIRDSLLPYNIPSADSENALKIIDVIFNALDDDPSTVFTEGGIIKDGWSKDLDYWRGIQSNFNETLESYAEEERQKTSIQNLRIRKNGNLGYFIEVTRGKLDKVPPHFIMKRTLVNAERYTTERLQELESNLNESEGHILDLEHDLFIEIRENLKQYVPYLQEVAHEIAYVDTIASFAQAAITNAWVKPYICTDLVFDIVGGRHPVVEKHLPSGEFVPNDISLFSEGTPCSFALITGPNMAGKSTFLRQNALIALLAQTGSFVPCDSAKIGIVDRIFCRVGASDNLARGESTFLVEMTETAHILRSATEKSLVIMDEVGRGTSTEDGLSIAWAVSEFLLDKIKCKTLFATHYHELTRLVHPALKMLKMSVLEDGKNIVFLRKVESGASENSYGLHVASLAGIPKLVLDRASFILEKIQEEATQTPIHSGEVLKKSENETQKQVEPKNFSLTGALFSDEELILDEILSADTDNLTPLAALQLVSRWKKTLSGR